MALFRKNDVSERAAADSGRQAAAEDARRLALEVAGHLPLQRVDPMGFGLVLEANEAAARVVQLFARSLDRGVWSSEEPCLVVVTDQRLLLRRSSGELVSLWWSTVVGLEVDLAQERMVLDFGDGRPCGLFGPQVAVAAVMGIVRLYGAEGLIRHPSLEPLRDGTVRPGP
ncbi:hypothetical protein [Intrasporangium calvum]|uniref:hypothetical protein n=1 Tax=Intrasporangium calvum TaxID=53358 RepID=UPI000DF5C889|nr:hypothetical protein [Intrasporangium calvum]AXG14504.1 hypothetical protein DN585_14780 [Intrasporangium calvum]